MISVLLPVFNGLPWLSDAIDSILAQSYSNWELIAIDDGSTDESAAVLGQYSDPRIRFFRQPNHGLAATLNRAIGLARGDYLARQDQDDFSFPRRFEKQVAFLNANPRCGMVGTWAEVWAGRTQTERVHRHPTANLDLQFDLLFCNHFVHSSMIIRREVFEQVGLYSTDRARQPPEDYELWSRVARQFEVANLPEVLHAYREVPGSMSRVGPNPFLERVVKLSAENLAWIRGCREPAAVDWELAQLVHEAPSLSPSRIKPAELRAVIWEAAAELCRRGGVPAGSLDARAQARWNSIRYRALLRQLPPLLRPVASRFAALYRSWRRSLAPAAGARPEAAVP